jgi:hypothetical protein
MEVRLNYRSARNKNIPFRRYRSRLSAENNLKSETPLGRPDKGARCGQWALFPGKRFCLPSEEHLMKIALHIK